MNLRDRLRRDDGPGVRRYQMREKLMSIGDDYWIEDEAGQRAFKIDVDGGPDLSAHGNLVDHEYAIEQDGDTVATVSKKWFRVRDIYGVEITPDQDDARILAIVVCIDAMTGD